MKRQIIIISAMLTGFCFLVVLSGQTWGRMLDKIVAVVNDDIILSSELMEAMQTNSWMSGLDDNKTMWNSEKERELAVIETINQIINTKLMEQEAKRLGIDISDKEVDRATKRILESNSLTRERLLIALAKEGVTFKKYQEQIRDDIRRSTLISEEINSKIKISDQDVKKYYENDLRTHQDYDEFNVQQIFLGVPPDAGGDHVEKIRQRMEAILSEIREGKSFESLAIKYSEGPSSREGGHLGFVRVDQMVTSLEESILALKPQSVSEVVRSPVGFHILKLLGKRAIKGKTLEGVQEGIRDNLFRSRTQEKLKEWLMELRDQAYIELKL